MVQLLRGILAVQPVVVLKRVGLQVGPQLGAEDFGVDRYGVLADNVQPLVEEQTGQVLEHDCGLQLLLLALGADDDLRGRPQCSLLAEQCVCGALARSGYRLAYWVHHRSHSFEGQHDSVQG